MFSFLSNGHILTLAHVGHIIAMPGQVGILRELPSEICSEGQAYPQLIVTAVAARHREATWQVDARYRYLKGKQTALCGPVTLELSPTGQLLISAPNCTPHGQPSARPSR